MSVRIRTDGDDRRITWTRLVDLFADSNQWEIDGSQPPSVQAHRVSSGQRGAVWFHIPGVDGKLELTHSAGDEAVCDLVFLSSLDVGLRENRSQFANALASGHDAIASKYVTEYLESHISTDTIITGRIPTSADKLSIQATIAAITAIAIEVHQLHDNITAPLTSIE